MSSFTDHPSRGANRDRVRFKIPRHNAVGSDNGSVPDPHPGSDKYSSSDPDIIPDLNWRSEETLVFDRHAALVKIMILVPD